MINKKRIVAIILLVCLMLTACGKGAQGGADAAGNSGSASNPDAAGEEILPVEVTVSDTPDLRSRVDAISYRMSLELDTKKDLLGETVTMTIKNNTDSDVAEVVIKNIAAGAIAYAKENYDSKVNQALTSNVYGIYADAPEATVAGAPENALEYRYTDDDKSIIIATLGSPLKPGETTELTVVRQGIYDFVLLPVSR